MKEKKVLENEAASEVEGTDEAGFSDVTNEVNMGEKSRGLKHWMIITLYLMLYDGVVAVAAPFLALWFRFDCRVSFIGLPYLQAYTKFIPIYAVFCVVVFWFCKLYRSIWRYASYTELVRTIYATIIVTAFHTIGITLIGTRMPISYYLITPVIQFLLTLGIRFGYRFVLLLRNRNKNTAAGRVMIVGAGSAGRMILRDITNSDKVTDKVYCIIDDNSNKWGRFVDGVRVVGGRQDILRAVEKYSINKIYIALPSISGKDRKEILEICKETDCELKNLPGMYQFVNGTVKASALRKVSVEDLLGREPINTKLADGFDYVRGKRVIVTGGGGSIGSELCRQIAAHDPALLIIFDIYENNAYNIQFELRTKYPNLNLEVLIGSVRNSQRVEDIFETYRPELVYHAAAHKHVPLMEDSPGEALKNNVQGTFNVAYAAMLYNAQRFVLISTDKAVNPTNIMGASKRMCEMIVQTFARKIAAGEAQQLIQFHSRIDNMGQGRPVPELTEYPTTKFAAVRFGNVLGSNGSVVPIFREQIEKGGPLTVTHPDIIRYFMTIPEAVSLVLQAGSKANGGEIFVLDMGTPMRIVDLAKNMIRLSGYKPGIDMDIVFTGLRPGEKLYEEKLMDEEGLEETENSLIHIGKPLRFDCDEFLAGIETLIRAAYQEQRGLRQIAQTIVSTYHPADIDGAIPEQSQYRKLMAQADRRKEA